MKSDEKTDKYDGLIEIRPEDVEEHQKIFWSFERNGKIYFPFKYIDVGYEQKCYGFIKKTELEGKC